MIGECSRQSPLMESEKVRGWSGRRHFAGSRDGRGKSHGMTSEMGGLQNCLFIEDFSTTENVL